MKRVEFMNTNEGAKTKKLIWKGIQNERMKEWKNGKWNVNENRQGRVLNIKLNGHEK